MSATKPKNPWRAFEYLERDGESPIFSYMRNRLYDLGVSTLKAQNGTTKA